jgi:hypothetical protein
VTLTTPVLLLLLLQMLPLLLRPPPWLPWLPPAMLPCLTPPPPEASWADQAEEGLCCYHMMTYLCLLHAPCGSPGPVRVSEGWQRAGWLTERGALGAAWTARVS